MSITQSTAGAGGGDEVEAAARAYIDGMAGDIETQWLHKGGWDEEQPAFREKVRKNMALALEAAALASASPAGQGNGAIVEWLAEQEAAARGRANDQRPNSSSEHWHRAQAAAYEAAHAYAIVRPDASAATASSTEEGKGFTCAARRQGSAGGNDPADCNWPVCGCDPHADKVIAALQESGLLASAPPAPTPDAGLSANRDLGPSLQKDLQKDPEAPPPGEDLAGQGEPVAWTETPSAIEAMAAHLLEEDHEPGWTWPTHRDDDGYRGGGGYVTIAPPDVQSHLRDKARRVLTRAAQIAANPRTNPAPAPSRPADRGSVPLPDLTPVEIAFDTAVEAYWREHFEGTAAGARRTGLQAAIDLALRDAPRNGGDGWKLVPLEMTAAMRDAAARVNAKTWSDLPAIYAAAIAVAPSPNAGDGTQDTQGGGR